jgi:hypothetical protein
VWGFLTVLSTRLGAPVLIVALLGYGIYMILEKSNQLVDKQQEINAQAEAASRQRLAEAQDRLLATHSTIDKMHTNVLTNIQSAMELQRLMQTELTQIQKEATAGRADVSRAASDVVAAKEDQARAQAELQRIKDETKRAREERIAAQGPFFDAVGELISLLNDQSGIPDNIRTLADEIRTSHLVNAGHALREFASDPGTAHAASLDRLEGIREQVIRDSIESGDTGFAVWYELVPSGPDGNGALLGFVKFTPEWVKGVVYLGCSTEGRVTDVETLEEIGFVSVPALEDWDGRRLWAMIDQGDGFPQTFEVEGARAAIALSAGSVVVVEEVEASEDMRRSNVIVGEGQRNKIMALETLITDRNPLLSDLGEERSLGAAIDMVRRSRSFEAAAVVGVSGATVADTESLRAAAIACLNAAVRKDEKVRKERASSDLPAGTWGRLGAAALAPDFVVKDVRTSVGLGQVVVDYAGEFGAPMSGTISFARQGGGVVGSQWLLSGIAFTASSPAQNQEMQFAMPPEEPRAAGR